MGKHLKKRNKDNFASFRDFLLFTQLLPYYGGLFLTIDLLSLGDNLLIPLLFNKKAKFCFHLFAVEPHWPAATGHILSHTGSLAIHLPCSYLVLTIPTAARDGADASITPEQKPHSCPPGAFLGVCPPGQHPLTIAGFTTEQVVVQQQKLDSRVLIREGKSRPCAQSLASHPATNLGWICWRQWLYAKHTLGWKMSVAAQLRQPNSSALLPEAAAYFQALRAACNHPILKPDLQAL